MVQVTSSSDVNCELNCSLLCVCVAWAVHSLRAIDLGVGDGADKRHNLAVVEEETHERDGRFLFLSTHLAQDVSRRCRHGLRG